MSRPGPSTASRGFTLIEVLIALAVISVGMLALAGLHLALARHADLARQRTEATHLAQSTLEELRAFQQVQATPGVGSYAAMASGQDDPALASNTRYQRRWTVGGVADDRERLVEVRVDWTDRSGEAAAVHLLSLIARSDPADSGRLALPPARPLQARPQDRALEIPAEATRLTGRQRGRSTLPWSGASGGHLVFDDASGEVIALCASAPGADTDLAVQCTLLPGYLLRGHLSGDWVAEAVGIAFTDARNLLAVPECVIAEVFDPADGRSLPGWRSYRCLMRAADHDLNPATPRAWSGRSVVLPEPPGGRSVCRITPDAATTDNALHPAIYTQVAGPLSQQNFVLVTSGECPAGSVRHQP